MNTLVLGDMFKWGWETFKKRPWFFVFALFILNLLSGGFHFNVRGDDPAVAEHMRSAVDFLLTPLGIALLIVGVIVGVAVSTLAGMGKINLLLKAHDNAETVSWKDIWMPRPFWEFLGTNIAYGLIIIAGVILLIVPGIIWAIKYQFAPYIVMEKNVRVGEALRESGHLTDGYKWRLFMFGLLVGIFNFVGLLCFVVGLFVTVPITLLATVHVYRVLQEKSEPMISPGTVA